MNMSRKEREKLAERIREAEQLVEEAENAKIFAKRIEEYNPEFTRLLQENKEFADIMKPYGPDYGKNISEIAESAKKQSDAWKVLLITQYEMEKYKIRRWEDVTSYVDVIRWISYKIYRINKKPESFQYKLMNGIFALAALSAFMWIYLNIGTWIDELTDNEPMTDEQFEAILNHPENKDLKKALEKMDREIYEDERQRF